MLFHCYFYEHTFRSTFEIFLTLLKERKEIVCNLYMQVFVNIIVLELNCTYL